MKILIILLVLPLQLLSQDISGIWTGVIHTQGSDLSYELVISGNNEKLSGYSLTVFTINGVENRGVKSVILKNKKGNVSLEDDKLIYSNYTTPAKRVKLFSDLSLTMTDSIMTLSGNFHTRTMDFRAAGDDPYTGTIFLRRQKNSAETKLISELDKLNLLNNLSFISPETTEKIPGKNIPATIAETKPKKKERVDTLSKKVVEKNIPAVVKAKPKTTQTPVKKTPQPIVIVKPAAAIAERKTEIIRNVFFRADSLLLTLYDNGTVDGDTVSVVLNGKIIIARMGLTENPLRVVVRMTPDLGDSLLLTMYAENLGFIPPNTGLLVIQDGNDRNEIRFEGDMQKSSAVILRRRR
jgi:hypothetical protein